MLLSELEERGRKFTLALRASIPVLLLISLVFYALFIQEGIFKPTLINTFLLTGIVFISVYFNYFMMDMSAKETIIDTTTHSFNEKAFINKLKDYRPKTLVLLVINNLYTINENYSVDKVDLLLFNIIQELNTTLKQYGLQNALIGRRYGAEFLIALDKDNYDVKEIFEKFIEDNKVLNDIEIDYQFSALTETKENIEHVLGQLRDLLSTISNQKSKISNIQDAKEISQIEQDIIDALNNKKFNLSFRPLLNTKNNQIDIYELASKLVSSQNKEILPRVFLPIINRLGLGMTYDLALVEHIVKLLPLVDDKISFTFNLSPFSLRNKKFQEKFFLLLNQHNINTSRIIIQLYERKTHHDLSSYFKVLTTFRVKGVRICIDNFGSSNASMEYMKHFKFDMIQFDRDYVTKLQDHTNLAMLTSLVTMSKELHILTVAKWVDKEEQKETLKSLGVDYLQGFGIDKPITEQQLINRYN